MSSDEINTNSGIYQAITSGYEACIESTFTLAERKNIRRPAMVDVIHAGIALGEKRMHDVIMIRIWNRILAALNQVTTAIRNLTV